MSANAKKNFDEDDNTPRIPPILPILPLRDTVIFPFIVSPLIVARPQSVRLINDVLSGDRMLGLVTQFSPQTDEPQPNDLYKYGTAAIVLKMLKFPDGTLRVLVQGLNRVKILKYSSTDPYLVANVRVMPEEYEDSKELEALARNISIQFQKVVSLVPQLPDELQFVAVNTTHPGKLADLVASNINLTVKEKQDLLEAITIKQRLEKLTVLLNRELEVLEMGSKIQDQVQTELSKNQREFFLREQLKAIQKELGMGDERLTELNELREKIIKVKMSKQAEDEALHELDRMSKMQPGSAEYTVSRTYLDWLISLPWSLATQDNLDIEQAERVLNEDHYDLKKVKQRILEYLAVRQLKSDTKGPILCFVGPPGVGKTSLGRSIARSMGRKFVRISLGGVRDEAEIRGHRRTYIGALPGRIIQGLKNAASNNPVFMLDEVDKIGTDFRGDPSSALLEVLDPEQNFSFSDHYLDVPFDLSKVMFITTANVLYTIPSALRDRMEVLEIPGYTEQDKVEIAMRYLVPRQLSENGLTAKNISFSRNTIQKIISEYTREAGVRNLEREIGSICRKVATHVAKGKKEKEIISARRVVEFLGPQKFYFDVAERTNEPGIATGLAWTPTGGDILFIECTRMPGNKGLILTGQLGEVMRESAQAALSYIRTYAAKFKIDPQIFEKNEIHIHVPAGGIPKDGPSAGVAITSSLVSLLTGKPTQNNLAMTGEITLRGKVLPVGGIKEKVLAARRAGIKRVILPKKNKNDMEDIPKDTLQEMEFIFVDRLEEVLNIAVLKHEKKVPKSKTENKAVAN